MSQFNQYVSGTLVTESCQFFNASGVAADPTTIVLKYLAQGNALVILTYGSSAIVRDGTGAYHYNYDTTGYSGAIPQLVTMEWIGTGTVQAINVDYFQVLAPVL